MFACDPRGVQYDKIRLAVRRAMGSRESSKPFMWTLILGLDFECLDRRSSYASRLLSIPGLRRGL